ncbi:porphobilinogen synthase [Devosia subaequoris]|uniref:Delta-aminolevulinic acid dehydratase n=1 Tax=Devosia subaequoris TaxID=395930 RepID=A0A7W6IJI1_9HYPH|nr:porphobilinogen synthase [Devosia subaequoris]MBB4050823.1 porphobilinogen synthase [Devosia subaequoris]MCP1208499.1 porphobilinogen synthase [Devosia subaequoris]
MTQNWPKHDMSFLSGRRLRRLRQSAWSRAMVRETELLPRDLIWPLFVIEGQNEKTQIRTMPGVERLSIDLMVDAARQARDAGIPALAIFPNTPDDLRSENGAEAYNPDNLMCRALSTIKQAVPEIGLIADVALDEYSSDGQDGLVRDGEILNDETVAVMVKSALAQARAGADIIAPSDMMDGRVAAIRAALDAEGFEHVQIMSYSAKYASCFYGPFREAVGSGSRLKGDKRTYQMDYANSDEALREIEQDIVEGADSVMVKPGMPYLDVIRRARDAFSVPIYAYQVSGEYAMIEMAGAAGAINRDAAVLESLWAFKRAGANGILTYYALEMARRLGN